MTKSELIAQLAERFPQLVAKDADLAVKMILDAMSEALVRGDEAAIVGVLIQTFYFGLSYLSFKAGVSAGGVAIIVCLQPILVGLIAPHWVAKKSVMRAIRPSSWASIPIWCAMSVSRAFILMKHWYYKALRHPLAAVNGV